MTKKTVQGAKTNIHMKYGYRNCLSDSVGAGGKNIAGDVMLVYRKLRELGYPNNKDVNICDEEMIKGIKFYQAAIMKIPISGVVSFPDGKIDPGGPTEKSLFSTKAPKYEPLKKGDIKTLQSTIEKKKNDAINGSDDDLKKYWEKIMEVWNAVSIYLPDGTTMSSGYRSTDEQRNQLHERYTDYQDAIIQNLNDEGKNGVKLWNEYEDLQKETLDIAKQSEVDNFMHDQVKAAGGQAALPGFSQHEHGLAIDTQTSPHDERVRALLWYSIEKADEKKVVKIINEPNKCVHFEFI